MLLFYGCDEYGDPGVVLLGMDGFWVLAVARSRSGELTATVETTVAPIAPTSRPSS